MTHIFGLLTATIHPGAEPWTPPDRVWHAIAPGLLGPQHVSLHPRADRDRIWRLDHAGRPPPGGPAAFRAYTLKDLTRIFVDATETRASVVWLLLHELGHADLNRNPAVAKPLRSRPRPKDYATSDRAHEAVVEEQVCNRIADVLAPRFGSRPGLNRFWWRRRVDGRDNES